MLRNITIGQYVPGNSPIHRMDPRVKIILSFFFIALLFILDTVAGYLAVTVFLGIIVSLSGVSLKFMLRGLKPMLMILLFTITLNIFMTPGEPIYTFNIGKFELGVTKEGIRMGVLMLIRLVYLVVGTSVLTLTTTPLMLTDGIERLLKPFEKIKVPAHEIAMMMTIALRFIPTIAEEADKIIKAQTARGADFESGNVIRRAKALVPLLVPLFISAFRRADDLATAMDARCYHGGKNRTRLNVIRLGRIDFYTSAVFALCFAGVVYINCLG